MPFTIRPFRRFPVHCAITYNAGPIPQASAGPLFGFWVTLRERQHVDPFAEERHAYLRYILCP